MDTNLIEPTEEQPIDLFATLGEMFNPKPDELFNLSEFLGHQITKLNNLQGDYQI